MMKLHTTGGLCAAFIISFLWIFTASGQTDIAVSDANATFSPNLGRPASAFETSLQQVVQRVFGDYSNATLVQMLVDAPTAMRTAMSSVTPRVSPDYASANQAATLVYPRALINDQVPPQLVGTVVRKPGSAANSMLLTWQITEFAQSTLDYGTAPGSYTQSVVVGSFATRPSVEVGNLTPGTTYYGRIKMVDLSENEGLSAEFSFSLQNLTAKPLVLIYAVLDNNLGDNTDDLDRLVKNVFTGTHSAVDVRLLIDSPGPNNSYIYEVQAGTGNCAILTDPTCGGRYLLGTTYWRANEDTAHPKALFDFVQAAVVEHPNLSQILLSLVGHGSGWTAGAIPGQPSTWNDQPSNTGTYSETLGGLLWDDTIGNTTGNRSMSTKALGQALEWIQLGTGRTIDLLYLDACSMGMIEVAYEVRNSARYLLASPNTDWASFAYDGIIQATKPNMPADTIGKAWMDAEINALDSQKYGYPYTFGLYDLQRMEALATAVQQLGGALRAALGSQKAAVSQAYAAAERYESNYDGKITEADDYMDLGSLAKQLDTHVGTGALGNSVQTVLTTINQMAVIQFKFRNGQPHTYPGNNWEWENALGIGIYFPKKDDLKRPLYSEVNLQWLTNTKWNEFLNAYWGDVVAATPQELPTCNSTRGCTPLPRQLEVIQEAGGTLYLPLIRR